MNRYVRTNVIAIALLLGIAITMEAQEIGRIEYIEGDVQLLRDDEIRDAFDLPIGTPVFELDVIQTGYDGYAEVTITADQNTTIRVRENSAYYVEIRESNGGQDTRVRLLNGTLESTVRQIGRQARYSVETQTAVLGVRGTTFDVITSPDEATLLGVREGQVALEAGGREILAGANTAVEALPNQSPRGRQVDNLDSYYGQWVEVRLQAFRSGAATFIRAYARRYEDTSPNFAAAYRELAAFRPRLEAAVNQQDALGGDMRLRTETSPALLRMRSILPLFENTVYRLRELRRFHDQGIGRTDIGGTSSTEFFRRFARQEDLILRRLSEVRTIMRLYGEIEDRSFGGLPGDGGSPFGGESILDQMSF